VTNDRGDKLADHKVYFSRDDNKGKQIQSLTRLIDYVRPTILMGLSTIGGAFTPEILKQMATLNDRPVVFPLSNPSSKSECTFEDAVKYTNGKVLFASGSPFPDVEFEQKTLTPGQGNNMYVFPGIGLGAILCKSVSITQEMIYASALALSTSLSPEERAKDWLYPDIRRIRDVSVIVTRGVIRAAQEGGVDRELNLRTLNDEELDVYIKNRMYNPSAEKGKLIDEIQQLTQHLNGTSLNGTNGTSIKEKFNSAVAGAAAHL
jgi:malate dehydrogenase (oxaloacetate-decarboxylating)(NADP+)